MRTTGTVLLGLGFVLVAVAVLIQDPTAPDANIGAGVLVVFGIPIGCIGVALTVIHAVYRVWNRFSGGRAPRRHRRRWTSRAVGSR